MPTWSIARRRWWGTRGLSGMKRGYGTGLAVRRDPSHRTAYRRYLRVKWRSLSLRRRVLRRSCSMTQSVIVAGARTPIGRLLGGLKSLSGSDLGGLAIKGALDKAGVT